REPRPARSRAHAPAHPTLNVRLFDTRAFACQDSGQILAERQRTLAAMSAFGSAVHDGSADLARSGAQDPAPTAWRDPKRLAWVPRLVVPTLPVITWARLRLSGLDTTR